MSRTLYPGSLGANTSISPWTVLSHYCRYRWFRKTEIMQKTEGVHLLTSFQGQGCARDLPARDRDRDVQSRDRDRDTDNSSETRPRPRPSRKVSRLLHWLVDGLHWLYYQSIKLNIITATYYITKLLCKEFNLILFKNICSLNQVECKDNCILIIK